MAARKDYLLWTLTGGHMITHWYEGVFYLILVYIARDLGLSMTQVGLLIGIKLWTTALINMPLGLLADLVGRKGLLMALALAWLGIPYTLVSFAGSYAMVASCVALMVIGNQMWHPPAMSVISETYPERRGYGLAIHALGATAGDAIAPFVAGLLLSFLAWRQVALLHLVPGLVAAPVFLYFFRRYGGSAVQPILKEGEQNEKASVRSYGRHLVQTLMRGSLGRVLVVVGFRGLIQQGLQTFLPFFLVQTVGLPAALVGTYVAGFQTGGALGGPLSGWLSDRLGRRPVVQAGMLACGVLLILLATTSPGRWVLIPVTALGGAVYAMRPVLQAWSLDSLPRDMGGAAVGLTFGSQASFSSMAPIIGGIIADRYGLPATFLFLGSVALLGALLTRTIATSPVAAPEQTPASSA